MPELPFVSRDPASQQNFDALNKRTGSGEAGIKALEARFPVKAVDLDASSKELFPQLATAEALKFAHGTLELEWPGATRSANAKEVEHGLGVEPKQVIFSPQNTAAVIVTTTARSKTKMTVGGANWEGSPAAGTKVTIDWFAVG